MVRKMVTQDKNSKMQFMVLNSLSDQRCQIAKTINVILKSWGRHTRLNMEEMCKVQYKCTIYSSKQQEQFVVHVIKEFNTVIDGESCMDSFTKDELINLIELISVD